MAKRTPLQSVIVIRDGKRVIPPIGKPFDFSADEIKQLDQASPGLLSKQATVDLSEDGKVVGEGDNDLTETEGGGKTDAVVDAATTQTSREAVKADKDAKAASAKGAKGGKGGDSDL